MIHKHVVFFFAPPLWVHHSVDWVGTFTFLCLRRCFVRVFDLVSMVLTRFTIVRAINSPMHQRFPWISSSPLRRRFRVNFLIPRRLLSHFRWTGRFRWLLISSLRVNRLSLATITTTTLLFRMSLLVGLLPMMVVANSLLSITFLSLAASLSSLAFLVSGNHKFVDCFNWKSCQTGVASTFH